MSKVKVDNFKMSNANGRNPNYQHDADHDDDDDFYDDEYDQSRWTKGNQRKVLKFKEHKAK